MNFKKVDLKKLREDAQKNGPAPWHVGMYGVYDVSGMPIMSNLKDCQFIADMRNALPELMGMTDANKTLREALAGVIEWRATPEVQGVFSLASVHSYSQVTPEFSDWAGAQWKKAEEALSSTPQIKNDTIRMELEIKALRAVMEMAVDLMEMDDNSEDYHRIKGKFLDIVERLR